MGLSSSKSKTTTSQTGNTTEQTNATTQPLTPDWLSGAAQDYVGRIGAFGQQDPNSFVAGASPLQQQAWQNTGALSGWQGQAATAAQMAQQAGQRPANTINAPAMAVAGNVTAPKLASPSLVSGQGYSAPNIANSQGYAAARAGTPIQAASQGYTANTAQGSTIAPTTQAQAAQIGPTQQAQAQSLLTNLGSYMNPYTDRVVDTTLSGFDDQAGQVRAQQAADAARNRSFGGSRYGIREAQTEADLAQARAGTEAGLRSEAFNVGAGLSGIDAAARQQASLFNAQSANDRAREQAALQQQTGLFNADASNVRAREQAGLQQQAGLFNADARNQASAFGAGAANTAGMFNTGQRNQFALDQAGRADTASQFGAASANQRAAQQAALQAQAAQFGAGAINQAGMFNAGAANDMSQFGAGQNLQAQLANQAAQGDMSRFNAQLGTNVNQFNAQQGDTAQARALQASQQLGAQASDYGANTRADLQTMAALGDQQRQIEQSYALAPLAQLQAMGQLSGMTPYDILVGRQVNGQSTGTMTGTGTQTTTQSPSLFNQLLAVGNLASGFKF